MPEIEARIRKFCETVGSDATPELLIQTLRTHFISEKPNMIAFVGLEGSGIAGHCLLDIEQWEGCTFATVLQYQLDRAVPPDQLRACYAEVVKWATDRGAKGIQLLAANERVARVFRQKYSFVQHRILMRRSLDGSPSTPKN